MSRLFAELAARRKIKKGSVSAALHTLAYNGAGRLAADASALAYEKHPIHTFMDRGLKRLFPCFYKPARTGVISKTYCLCTAFNQLNKQQRRSLVRLIKGSSLTQDALKVCEKAGIDLKLRFVMPKDRLGCLFMVARFRMN